MQRVQDPAFDASIPVEKRDAWRTTLATGPIPFTAAVDGRADVRVLPVLAFNGAHVWGDRFYAAQKPSQLGSTRDVEHHYSHTWFRYDTKLSASQGGEALAQDAAQQVL